MPALRQASGRYLLGCGSLMVAYTVLLYAAVGMSRDREQIVAVTVANYLWPSLTLVFSVPLLGWRARPFHLAAGTAVALTGVALAVGAGAENSPLRFSWSSHAATTLPAVLAAIAWGLYSVLSRRWGAQTPGAAMCLFLLATDLVLLLVRCGVVEQTTWTWRAGGSRLRLRRPHAAGLPGLGRGRPARQPLSGCRPELFDAVASVAISSVYLGLAIGPRQWLAGGLVVAGAVVVPARYREK